MDAHDPLHSLTPPLAPFLRSRQQAARIRSVLTSFLAAHLSDSDQPPPPPTTTTATARPPSSASTTTTATTATTTTTPTPPGPSSASALLAPPPSASVNAAALAALPPHLLPHSSVRAGYLRALNANALARRRLLALRADVRDLHAAFERRPDNHQHHHSQPLPALAGSSAEGAASSSAAAAGGGPGAAAPSGADFPLLPTNSLELPVEAAAREYRDLLARRDHLRRWDGAATALAGLDRLLDEADLKAGLRTYIASQSAGPDTNAAASSNSSSGDNTNAEDAAEWAYRVQKELALARNEFEAAYEQRAVAKAAADHAIYRAAAGNSDDGAWVARQIYALTRARAYLVAWIDRELSGIDEAEAEAEAKVEEPETASEDDPAPETDTHTGQAATRPLHNFAHDLAIVQAHYDGYVAARAKLLETAAALESLQSAGSGSRSQPASRRDTTLEESKPAVVAAAAAAPPSALASLLLPHLPSLLRYARADRALAQQTGRIRRQTAAIGATADAAADRLLDTHLLSAALEGGDSEGDNLTLAALDISTPPAPDPDSAGPGGEDGDELARLMARIGAARARLLPSVAEAHAREGRGFVASRARPFTAQQQQQQQQHHQHGPDGMPGGPGAGLGQGFGAAVAGAGASGGGGPGSDVAAWAAASRSLRDRQDLRLQRELGTAWGVLAGVADAVAEVEGREGRWEKVVGGVR